MPTFASLNETMNGNNCKFFNAVSMVMTQEGATALKFASQEGHVAVVRLLLQKGADVNICTKVVMDFVSCTCVC